MIITSIAAIPYSLPIRREFRWNGLCQELGRFVLVRIRTDEGLTGYGDAVPLPDWGGEFGRRGGETRHTVVSVIEERLAPALNGADPCRISEAAAAMDRAIIGHTYAKSAVEMALFDILGKSVERPVCDLLGGPVRDRVQVAHMVGLMPADEAVKEAESAVADGFTALQIKGGEDPKRDLEVIRMLRKTLGGGVVLRLDANQGYGDAKTCLSILEQLDRNDLDFIEQPVEGLSALAATTRGTLVRVIADESCWTARDALDVVHCSGADCLSIYLAKAGGIRRAQAVAAVAEAAGLACDVNGSLESGVGNAANLQFALASPCVTVPSVIPVSAPAGAHPCDVGGNYFEDDIITEPFGFADGALLPLKKPGLSVDIDEGKLDRYRN